jgi:hypothetical protein
MMYVDLGRLDFSLLEVYNAGTNLYVQPLGDTFNGGCHFGKINVPQPLVA